MPEEYLFTNWILPKEIIFIFMSYPNWWFWDFCLMFYLIFKPLTRETVIIPCSREYKLLPFTMGGEVRVGWIFLFQSQVETFSCKQWSVLQLAAILNSSCLLWSKAGSSPTAKWRPVVLVSLSGGQLCVSQQWDILLGKTDPKSYLFSLSVSYLCLESNHNCSVYSFL